MTAGTSLGWFLHRVRGIEVRRGLRSLGTSGTQTQALLRERMNEPNFTDSRLSLGQHSSVDLDHHAWTRMEEIDPEQDSNSDSDDLEPNPPWADSGSGFQRGVDIGKAEKQFLLTLRKPRHVDAVGMVSPTRVAGVDMDKLSTLRVSESAKAKRDVLAEVEDIHRMDQYSIVPPWDQTQFPKVEEAYLNRKGEHDVVVNKFRQAVITLSDGLENQVIQACRDLREKMEDIDKAIQKVFDKFNEDDHLRMQDWFYVEETWVTLNGMLEDRSLSVALFGEQMEQLEEGRAKELSNVMRDFVAGLTSVSYVLKDEIARMVEAETQEINMVIIGNLLAHTECKSRLQRTDIEVRINRRAEFERRQNDWRKLRHDRALAEFNATISSKEYTNPVERQAILQVSKEQQQARHEEKRLGFYKRLFGLKAPLWSTEMVEDIRNEFKHLKEEEEEHNSILAGKLVEHGRSFQIKANEFREKLRAELHTYGALAEKSNLTELRDELALKLVDPDSEEFFRKSGGLKKDVQWIAVALGRPNLIYQPEAREALARVDQLCSYTNIRGLLEKQGKETDRKSIQDTLEKLRTGKKKDVPKRGAQLRKQLGKFAKINGLPNLMKKELNLILDAFDTLFPGAAPRDGSVSDLGSDSGRPETSASGTLSATSFGTDLVMNNLAEVRSLQNRAATVISACELSDEEKNILKDASLRLHQQIFANTLIDDVVRDICTEPIQKRIAEDADVQRSTNEFVVEQEMRLHNGALRVCDFFSNMTKMFEKHKTDAEFLDGKLSDELTDELDRFDAEHKKNEERLAKQLHKLRYSPSSKHLDEYFEAAINMLQKIEASYRKHWKQYMEITAKLMPESEAEAKDYCTQACQNFGIVPPQDAAEIKRLYDMFIASQENLNEENVSTDELLEEAVNETESDPSMSAAPSPRDTEENTEAVHSEEDYGDNDKEGDEEEEENNGGAEGEREEEEDANVEASVVVVARTPQEAMEDLQRTPRLHFGPTVQTTYLNVYNRDYHQQEPIFDIAKRLIGAPMVEQEIATPDIQEETDESTTDAPADDANVEHVATVIGNDGAPPAPYDVDRNLCSAVLVVPFTFLKTLLEELRQNFFEVMEGKLARRFDRLTELTNKRETKSTAELEERIRLHWPRKGYTDVKYRQPRVYEISQHRKKLERQKRTVIFRNRSHESEFNRNMSIADEGIDTFRGKLNLLDSMLDSQTNLAGLQGVVQRCKDAIVDFDNECATIVDAMRPLVEAEPNMLIESNARFLGTCLTYEEDGDYDPKEVQQCLKALNDVDDSFHRTAQNRKNAINNLRERQTEAKNGFTDFMEHFNRTLQDLSMKEGLGKKYGRPRRNAQERLRNEVSQCDNAHQKLDEAIRTIESIIVLQPGEETDQRSIARRLVSLLVIVRKDYYARALYLETLKDEFAELDVPEIDLSGIKAIGKEPSVNLDDPETELFFTNRKFAKSIDDLIEQCKVDTRELYEREGKLEMAGPDGVPSKLKTYLASVKRDTTAYLTTTRIAYRDQLRKFQEVSALLPYAVVADISARATYSMYAQTADIESKFETEYAFLGKQMDAHSNELRPSLASPNNIDELNTLCEVEEARNSKSMLLLNETLKNIKNVMKTSSDDYLFELNAATKVVLSALDSMVAPWHIMEQPGDKEIELAKERRSLKSLRRKTISKDAGTFVEEGELVQKNWPGLPTDAFARLTAGPKPEQTDEEEVDKTEEPVTEGDGGEPAVSETLVCLSTRCTRAMVKARKRSYDEYLKNFSDVLENLNSKYESMLQKEAFFKFNWDKRIAELRAQTKFGGFN